MPIVMCEKVQEIMYDTEIELLKLRNAGELVYRKPILCKLSGKRYDTTKDFLKDCVLRTGRMALLSCTIAQDIKYSDKRHPEYYNQGYYIEVDTRIFSRDLTYAWKHFNEAVYNKNLLEALKMVRDNLKQTVFETRFALKKARRYGNLMTDEELQIYIQTLRENSSNETAVSVAQEIEADNESLPPELEERKQSLKRDVGEYQTYNQMIKYVESLALEVNSETPPTRKIIKCKILYKYKLFLGLYYGRQYANELMEEEEKLQEQEK